MKKKQINNKPVLKSVRKDLRNNPTDAEKLLWKHLKNRQFNGKKFRRQFSVETCILDFYCPAEKLAIELDGAHHYIKTGVIADENRDDFLNNLGIKVLRFENKQVFEDMENVLNEIKSFLDPSVPPGQLP